MIKWIGYAAISIMVLFIFPETLAAQPTATPCVTAAPDGTPANCVMVDQEELGFSIPTLSDILTFAIRMMFVIGGLAALIFLLLGAFAWIASGGDKDKVAGAMSKIQAAVLGVIMIAVVLAIIVTLEQVVFAQRICLGLSCPITIPALLKPPAVEGSTTVESGATVGSTPVITTTVESDATNTYRTVQVSPTPYNSQYYPGPPNTGSGNEN